MNFKNLAIITSLITLFLGMGYLFFGAVVIGRWQIESTESMLLLGRRMGSLYLGLSIIFFLARSSPESIARKALITGTAFTLSLLVVLGIYELVAGRVGNGILVSIVVEALLAISYLQMLFSDRNSGTKRLDLQQVHENKDKEVTTK